MPRRAKGGGARAGGRTKARSATKGLRVTAVKATAGRAATSVDVEVEPDELKSEVGEFEQVRSVSARIPEESDRPGRVRWREEPLRPAGASERETGGRRRKIQRYFNVHYGPSPEGVGVQVETDRGTVNAPRPGHSYSVKDDSQPGESEVKKRKR